MRNRSKQPNFTKPDHGGRGYCIESHGPENPNRNSYNFNEPGPSQEFAQEDFNQENFEFYQQRTYQNPPAPEPMDPFMSFHTDGNFMDYQHDHGHIDREQDMREWLNNRKKHDYSIQFQNYIDQDQQNMRERSNNRNQNHNGEHRNTREWSNNQWSNNGENPPHQSWKHQERSSLKSRPGHISRDTHRSRSNNGFNNRSSIPRLRDENQSWNENRTHRDSIGQNDRSFRNSRGNSQLEHRPKSSNSRPRHEAQRRSGSRSQSLWDKRLNNSVANGNIQTDDPFQPNIRKKEEPDTDYESNHIVEGSSVDYYRQLQSYKQAELQAFGPWSERISNKNTSFHKSSLPANHDDVGLPEHENTANLDNLLAQSIDSTRTGSTEKNPRKRPSDVPIETIEYESTTVANTSSSSNRGDGSLRKSRVIEYTPSTSTRKSHESMNGNRLSHTSSREAVNNNDRRVPETIISQNLIQPISNVSTSTKTNERMIENPKKRLSDVPNRLLTNETSSIANTQNACAPTKTNERIEENPQKRLSDVPNRLLAKEISIANTINTQNTSAPTKTNERMTENPKERLSDVPNRLLANETSSVANTQNSSATTKTDERMEENSKKRLSDVTNRILEKNTVSIASTSSTQNTSAPTKTNERMAENPKKRLSDDRNQILEKETSFNAQERSVTETQDVTEIPRKVAKIIIAKRNKEFTIINPSTVQKTTAKSCETSAPSTSSQVRNDPINQNQNDVRADKAQIRDKMPSGDKAQIRDEATKANPIPEIITINDSIPTVSSSIKIVPSTIQTTTSRQDKNPTAIPSTSRHQHQPKNHTVIDNKDRNTDENLEISDKTVTTNIDLIPSTSGMHKKSRELNSCVGTDVKLRHATVELQKGFVEKYFKNVEKEKKKHSSDVKQKEPIDKEAVKLIKVPIKQLQILLILLKETYHSNVNISLLPEVKDSKDLCDSILCLEENKNGLIEYDFYKINYVNKKNDTSRISYKMLSGHDYDVKVYFNHYLKHMKSGFSGLKKAKNFTIITNLELNKTVMAENNVKVIGLPNDKPTTYKLELNEKHKLYCRLVECTAINILASNIAQNIKQKTHMAILAGKFKDYHIALIREQVFQTSECIENNKMVHIAKFHPEFLKEDNNLSAAAKKLRILLKQKLVKLDSNSKMYVSAKFGKHKLFGNTPEIINKSELTRKLLSAIESSYTEKKIVTIVRNHDVDLLIGRFFEKRNGIMVFTQSFINKYQFPGNLNNVISSLDEECKLKNIPWKNLSFCRFIINNLDDDQNELSECLPNDGSRFVQEFFNKLQFVIIRNDIDHLLRNKNLEVFTFSDVETSEAVQKGLLDYLQTSNHNVDLLTSLKSVVSKSNAKKNTFKLPNSKIKFSRDFLNELDAKLQSSKKVLDLETSYVELYTLLMWQLAKEIYKYTENNQCYFFKVETFLKLNDFILEILKLPETKLIVLQDDKHQLGNSDLSSVLTSTQNYLSSANNDGTKKVVVIRNPKSSAKVNQLLCLDHKNVLSEDSRQEVINASLHLHKKKILYKELMSSEEFDLLLENPQFLTQLMMEELKIGEELIVPYKFDKQHHIPARIKRNVIINHEIFNKGSINDVFLISNIDQSNFQEYLLSQKSCYFHQLHTGMQFTTRFILIGTNNVESNFDEFVKANKQCKVHLIKYESGIFTWQKSNNSISSLFNFAYDDLKSNYNRDLSINNDVKETVIISGESGAGKSVYLYNLAKRLVSQRDNRTWVIQLNLSKFLLTKHLNKSLSNLEGALNMLADILNIKNFHKEMLFMCAKGKLDLKLVILFDGYDELNFEHSNLATKLIKILQNSKIHKIYVPTRPNFKRNLEMKLGVFAYNLDEFTNEEKLEFFSKQIKDPSLASSTLSPFFDKEWPLLPQQLSMLASIQRRSKSLDVSEFDSIYDLYRCYVKMFYEKTTNKSKSSVKRIINDKQFEDLCALDRDEDYQNLRHITIAEYFAAEWLSEYTKSCKELTLEVIDCANKYVDSLSPVFFLTLCEKLKLKADTQKSFEKFASMFANHGFEKFLKAFLEFEQFDANMSLLHSAVKSDHEASLKIVETILKHCDDVKDDYGILIHGNLKSEYKESALVKFVNSLDNEGCSALQLACKSSNKDNMKIACALLLHGADDWGLEKEHHEELALYVAKELENVEVNEKHHLRPLAEKLFRGNAKTIVKHSKLSKIISYFLTHGRNEIFEEILDAVDEEDRYNLIKDTDYFITTGGTLTDNERMKIMKYLLEKCGTEIRNRNKDYVSQLLKGAAYSSHLKTYQYFIDQNPDGHIGFLTTSLRTNQLQCIDFLMRNSDWTTDLQGNHPLHQAIRLGVSLKTISHLIKKGGIENQNNLKKTPLCVALEDGADIHIIKYLVKEGALINVSDESGMYAWCYILLKESSRFDKGQQQELMDLFLQRSNNPAELPPNIGKSFGYDQRRDEVARKFEFFKDPKNFKLDLKNSDGDPRLHAALKGQEKDKESEWCRFLISYGANVNSTNKDMKTPFHVALERKNYYVAKLLLQNGAMFDALDINGKIPKLEENNNDREDKDFKDLKKIMDIASKLFDSKRKFPSDTKKYFLHNHIKSGSSIMRCLIKCRNKERLTLLHMAALANNQKPILDIIKFGLECNKENPDFKIPDVNDLDKKHNTPMHLAAKKGFDKVVAELLYNGGDFDSKNNDRQTPKTIAKPKEDENQENLIIKVLLSAENIFNAVESGDFNKFNKLLATEKRLIGVKKEHGTTLLHQAVQHNHTKSPQILYELLRQNSIVLDALDSKQNTPLHYAVKRNNLDYVKMLLKAGAIYDLRNSEKLRPFDMDRKLGPNRCVDLLNAIEKLFRDLESPKPKIFVNDCPSILMNYLDTIHKEFQIGKDVIVNVLNHKGNTLLHYSTKYDLVNSVSNLLKSGAIYNVKNKMRKSPSDLAISTTKLFESIKSLFGKLEVDCWEKLELDRDIIINCRCVGGYTLLHETISKKEKIPEIKWLLLNKAAIEVTNNKGRSVMECAGERFLQKHVSMEVMNLLKQESQRRLQNCTESNL